MLVLFNIAPAVWSEWCLQRIDGAALNLAIFEIVYPLVISLIPIPGKGEGHFGEISKHPHILICYGLIKSATFSLALIPFAGRLQIRTPG